MPVVGNFHPQWGYVAPVPGAGRTLRIVLVATAVGATAGAGAVFALMDHPGVEQAHQIASLPARGTPGANAVANAVAVGPNIVAASASPQAGADASTSAAAAAWTELNAVPKPALATDTATPAAEPAPAVLSRVESAADAVAAESAVKPAETPPTVEKKKPGKKKVARPKPLLDEIIKWSGWRERHAGGFFSVR